MRTRSNPGFISLQYSISLFLAPIECSSPHNNNNNNNTSLSACGPNGYGTGHTSNGDPIGFGAALSVECISVP
jgi:hypothetical protein